MRILILAVGLMSATPLYAANWWYVMPGGAQSVLFVDEQSLARVGSKVTVWVHEDLGVAQDGVDSRKMRLTIDCAAHTSKATSLIEYTASGSVKRSADTRYAEEEDIVPDTVGEGISKTICRDSADWLAETNSLPVPEGVDLSGYADRVRTVMANIKNARTRTTK